MFVPTRVLTVLAVLVGLGGGAVAETIAVGSVSAEADVADEAGAVTLLVHTALVGDDRKLVGAPPELTVGTAATLLPMVGADHGVLMDLGRDGLALRLTVVIVAAAGDPDVLVVRAADGDVQALARGAVERVTTKLALIKGRVPDVAFGRLRPYATALRLRGANPAGAAGALADATPSTALNVTGATTLLAGVPAAVPDVGPAAVAARALGDAKHLDALGAGSDETAVAARALAALARSDVSAAKAALAGKPAKGGLATLVAARLAELAGDTKRLDQLLVQGLATDQARAVLAFASSLETIDKAIYGPLVAAAEKVTDAPGVTAQLGLAAADAGFDKARALALVSVRELDEHGLRRVEALIAGATDPTSLRLRAELSMRKQDGREELAIGAFVRAAPDDPRALRYRGWLLGTQGKHAEAAAAFAKAGARGEQVRALLNAGDIKAAAALITGTPSSPEERVALGRVALGDGKLADAEALLVGAERTAPTSPLVQTAIIDLGTKQGNSVRVRMGRLLVGIAADTPIVAPPVAVAPAGPTRSGKPEKIVIDLGAARADQRPIAPMLEALQLAELAKKKIVLAELRWSSSTFGFRETNPTRLRNALAQLLTAPPYEMQVVMASKAFDGEAVPLEELIALGTDADAVLIYRLEPAGGRGEVTLLLHHARTSEAAQVSRVIDLDGLVAFNVIKLGVIVGAGVTLLLIGILYFTRAMGRVELQIARETSGDEALCVEISKNPGRPRIDDMLAFHEATKSAGAKTRPRHATLIASGFITKVPVGTWYVHLYGTYSHAGKLRVIPDWCTKQVEVKRGERVEVDFDLVAKGAEVTVEVIAEPRAGVLVWTDKDPTKRTTTDAGVVELMLPLGSYVIYIDAHGTQLSTEINVSSAKAQRVTINVARELRLMKGIELDANAATANDLELVLTPSGPSTPRPATGPAPASDATARTQAAAGTEATAFAAGPHHPRAETPVPGDVLLGRYRVTAELGRGAMGLVHRAWDEKLEREVAIKEMADDLRSIPEAMQLFTQEAKALAQLNHTNIVAMYDQVTDDKKVYMIMEYVDGQPLEAIVAARGALPWLEAVGLIDQACAGLAYAHARKVIHRDIKPANIFVATDKTVKLGDFGLARVMREVTIRRTEIRGTPLYMAPEQITGTDVDHRCDLYAVGCTLFELVCGRPPFVDGDILYAQMNTAPPVPSSFTPDIPKPLEALILALIAKHPDDRPGSANEVRAMLRDLANA